MNKSGCPGADSDKSPASASLHSDNGGGGGNPNPFQLPSPINTSFPWHPLCTDNLIYGGRSSESTREPFLDPSDEEDDQEEEVKKRESDPNPSPRMPSPDQIDYQISIQYQNPLFEKEYGKYYVSNKIKTSKYTLVTFLPLNLYNQFRRSYNLYFLLAAILGLVPTINPLNRYTSFIPLLLVVTLTLIKDGIADMKRHTADRQVNSLPCLILREGRLLQVPSQDVRVGDLMIVRKNEKVLADLIVLTSSDTEEGAYFMETSDLDGETNVKRREVPYKLRKLLVFNTRFHSVQPLETAASSMSIHDAVQKTTLCDNPYLQRDVELLRDFKGVIQAELPNDKIHSFKGRLLLYLRRSSLAPSIEPSSPISIEKVDPSISSMHTSPLQHQGIQMSPFSFENTPLNTPSGRQRHMYTYEYHWPFQRRSSAMCNNTRDMEAGPSKTPISTQDLHTPTSSLHPPPLPPYAIPLHLNHFLPRASVLRSTSHVIGVVLYAGSNTRIFRNLSRQPLTSKSSLLLETLNSLTLFIILLNFLTLCLAVLFGSLFLCHTAQFSAYLFPPNSSLPSSSYSYISTVALQQVGAYFILFTYMIPISLFVSIEMARLIHASFMQWDPRMAVQQQTEPSNIPKQEDARSSFLNRVIHFSKERKSIGSLFANSQRHCLVKNFNIHEDLARVQYILSDKTGTLTQNKMRVSKWLLWNNGSILNSEGEEEKNEQNTFGQWIEKGKGLLLDEQGCPGALQACLSSLHGHRRRCQPDGLENFVSLFLQHVSTCHSVLPTPEDQHSNNGISDLPSSSSLVYEGQSPDEVAIVQCLADNGVVLSHRTKRHVTYTFTEHQHFLSTEFTILRTLEFTSERRKMSVLVQDPHTPDRVFLFVKGADSVILPSLDDTAVTSESERASFQFHIDSLSRTGLRLLVLAWRAISRKEYLAFKELADEAERSLSDTRDAHLEHVYGNLESRLCLLGAVAIEDKLQRNVPLALHTLLSASISVWLLTGDKRETALNVAVASRLLSPTSFLISLTDAVNYTDFYTRLSHVLDYDISTTHSHIACVMDGKGLDFALETPAAREKWMRLVVEGSLASIICCRVSPIQKSRVVDFLKLQSLSNPVESSLTRTLAIGDGANDVSMIQSAHLGVGISGREGNQAARAADFSLPEFQALSSLILLHGRYSLLRLSKLIQISIYKNFTLIYVQFFYGMLSGWSAQSIYNSYFLLLYNVLFTSVGPFLLAVFEKDVNDDDLLFQYPQLYRPVRDGIFLNKLILFKTLFWSIYNSIIIFFFIWGIYDSIDISNANGLPGGLSVQQALTSTMTFLTVTLRTFLYTRHWVIGTFIAFLLSFLVFLGNMFALEGVDYFQLYAGVIIYQIPIYYFAMLLIPLTCLFPEFILKYYRKQYHPRDEEILEEMSRLHTGEPPK